MARDRWNDKYDWIKEGDVWVQKDRSELYNDDRFISVNDVYFRDQKYLSGVSFTYVNKIQDIYKRDLLTGDGYSITNMYNEYDIVDRHYFNVNFVDTASNSNVDLTKQWRKIDNVRLLTNQLVLLKNQNSEFENGIYRVTKNSFLEKTEILSSRDKSWRYSSSVKMGSNKDKQFFLTNNGGVFPTTDEPKYFIEGKSLILKHIIKYNLYNTSSNSALTSKVIFTDYEIARKQLPYSTNLYEKLLIGIIDSTSVSTYYFNINYRYDTYTIRKGTTNDHTGVISGTTFYIENGDTVIEYTAPFSAVVGDYVNVRIYSGSVDYMIFSCYVKAVTATKLYLIEKIPLRAIRDLEGKDYTITNYNIATSWTEAIEFLGYTPYSRFFEVVDTYSGTLHDLEFSTEEFDKDRYFDYDSLSFDIADGSSTEQFYTQNHYTNYTLLSRLVDTNPAIFGTSYPIYNDEILNVILAQHVGGDRIKLTFNSVVDDTIFRPYTYVIAVGSTDEKTLILDVEGSTVTIEKPANYIYSQNPSSIQNIKNLGTISDILQKIYINEDYDWYIPKSENDRRKVSSTYGQIVSEDDNVRIYTTGLIYENTFNEFVFKLYNADDDNLVYDTIEGMFLGVDRKTRFPAPLDLSNRDMEYVDDWNVLDGGVYSYYDVPDIFDFGYDSVLGGPNDPPFMYTTIDGNDE